MMRVVLDVNVLVSGFVAKDGSPSDILAGWSNMAFELVVSEHILEKAVPMPGASRTSVLAIPEPRFKKRLCCCARNPR